MILLIKVSFTWFDYPSIHLSICPSSCLDNHLIFSVDAAEVLRQNRRLFEQNVAKSMRGGYVGSVYFERCLK